jgi:hypothetical protein
MCCPWRRPDAELTLASRARSHRAFRSADLNEDSLQFGSLVAVVGNRALGKKTLAAQGFSLPATARGNDLDTTLRIPRRRYASNR